MHIGSNVAHSGSAVAFLEPIATLQGTHLHKSAKKMAHLKSLWPINRLAVPKSQSLDTFIDPDEAD